MDSEDRVSGPVSSGRMGQASDGRNQISVVCLVGVDPMLVNPACRQEKTVTSAAG